MIRVEKMVKGGWFTDQVCKSMREAKRKAKKLSESHDGEVKAEKTDRDDYNLETHYYENGEHTNSYS